jgi:hypothetical protein
MKDHPMKDHSGTADAPTPSSTTAGGPADRRDSVLEPGSGSQPGSAATIREQQGNSAGGMVPAGFTGSEGSDDPPAARHPEDAAGPPSDADAWDSEG